MIITLAVLLLRMIQKNGDFNMCAVCRDWQLGKLTTEEAWRNLNEMKDLATTTDEEVDHFWEVAQKLANESEF